MQNLYDTHDVFIVLDDVLLICNHWNEKEQKKRSFRNMKSLSLFIGSNEWDVTEKTRRRSRCMPVFLIPYSKTCHKTHS